MYFAGQDVDRRMHKYSRKMFKIKLVILWKGCYNGKKFISQYKSKGMIGMGLE